MSNSPKKSVWFFHPIIGIEVDHTADSLRTPIFKHCTLLEHSDIAAFFQAIGVLPDPKHRDPVLELMMQRAGFVGQKKDIGQEKRHCMVAAQGFGSTHEAAEHMAMQRIHMISNMLAFATIVRSDLREGCCRPEHITFEVPRFTFGIDPSDSSFRHELSPVELGYHVYIPSPPIRLLPSEIQRILQAPPVGALTTLLLDRLQNTDTTAKHSADVALRTLVGNINGLNAETQLTGAVTVLDVLLSPGPSNFNTIESRLRGLLGTDAFDGLNAQDTLSLRHNVVHEGASASESDARQAMMLACLTLLTYAAAIQRFGKRSELFNYLDYLPAAQKLQNSTPSATTIWTGLTTDGLVADMLPFRILQHLYRRQHIESLSDPQRRSMFAPFVLAYAAHRTISVHEAYDTMCSALTGIPSPFATLESFHQHVSAHYQQCRESTDMLLAYVREHQWVS